MREVSLENIIGNAIVPMHIGRAVYGKSVVLRQLFAPRCFIAVDRPIVTVYLPTISKRKSFLAAVTTLPTLLISPLDARFVPCNADDSCFKRTFFLCVMKTGFTDIDGNRYQKVHFYELFSG